MIPYRLPLRGLALTLLAAATLSACSGEAETPAGPGAISEGEARALDEAAKMLDAKRLPEGALPDVDPPIEAAPEPDARDLQTSTR